MKITEMYDRLHKKEFNEEIFIGCGATIQMTDKAGLTFSRQVPLVLMDGVYCQRCFRLHLQWNRRPADGRFKWGGEVSFAVLTSLT